MQHDIGFVTNRRQHAVQAFGQSPELSFACGSVGGIPASIFWVRFAQSLGYGSEPSGAIFCIKPSMRVNWPVIMMIIFVAVLMLVFMIIRMIIFLMDIMLIEDSVTSRRMSDSPGRL